MPGVQQPQPILNSCFLGAPTGGHSIKVSSSSISLDIPPRRKDDKDAAVVAVTAAIAFAFDGAEAGAAADVPSDCFAGAAAAAAFCASAAPGSDMKELMIKRGQNK